MQTLRNFSVLLAFLSAACGKNFAGLQERHEIRKLEYFKATTQYGQVSWSTYDTSANNFTFEIRGSTVNGTARAAGEWWVETTSNEGSYVGTLIYGSFSQGSFNVWNDSLYVTLIDDMRGDRFFLWAIPLIPEGNRLVGSYTSLDEFMTIDVVFGITDRMATSPITTDPFQARNAAPSLQFNLNNLVFTHPRE